MRAVGVAAVILGVLMIAVSMAVPVLEPLGCVGLMWSAFGLIVVLSTFKVRAMPKTPADISVQTAFMEVANDPHFQLVAELLDEELRLLLDDLSKASYRRSRMGWAGREEGGLIVLAASAWRLRRASVAHELFHLARDVISRSRDESSGCDLHDDRNVLREELIVWWQTLQYDPVRATIELSPFLGFAVVGLWGAYVLSWNVC